MRVGVIGTRKFYDYNKVKHTLDYIHTTKTPITCIVSGGAKGADKFGEQWALENNIPTDIYYPDWDEYGKRAGFIRNHDIIKNSDIVIAFWDRKSRGTKHSIDLCEEYGKKCLIVEI